MNNAKTIYVYSDWGNGVPELIGILYAESGRGKELFSFEYDKTWLKNSSGFTALDPDLAMFEGRQYTPADKALFGLFSDSCPDRWGRLLMKRREAVVAKQEERKPRALLESDFLLGVFDKARMGALRFATIEGGPFLSESTELSTPPWTTLRALENATMSFENDENGTDSKWITQLLAPGSSLGGARPKATVAAPDGSLWIAKFPSKHDEWDSGAWEMVAHELAVSCGLNVPEAKLERFSKNGSTFIIKRFDRNNGKRIHFASAMTLLGKIDGASGSDGTSYLDMVSFLKSNGSSPKQDVLELWKRIVFSIAVSNTDDHLRNHAFIMAGQGWQLSPMYDVNPNIYGDTLSLNITTNDNRMRFDVAYEVAKHFDIESKQADEIIKSICSIVDSDWRALAEKFGLSRSAIEHMEPAFDMKLK
jgi:serine/threonine-protein kinase HipA